MENNEYDVIVVGAGPAGSVAARVVAENNYRVLVLEKKQEIGTPKRCAEGFTIVGMNRGGVEPNPVWALNKIIGVILHSPSGKTVKATYKEDMQGYLIERKIFEKHLAADAIREGALENTPKALIKEKIREVLRTFSYAVTPH